MTVTTQLSLVLAGSSFHLSLFDSFAIAASHCWSLTGILGKGNFCIVRLFVLFPSSSKSDMSLDVLPVLLLFLMESPGQGRASRGWCDAPWSRERPIL